MNREKLVMWSGLGLAGVWAPRRSVVRGAGSDRLLLPDDEFVVCRMLVASKIANQLPPEKRRLGILHRHYARCIRPIDAVKLFFHITRCAREALEICSGTNCFRTRTLIGELNLAALCSSHALKNCIRHRSLRMQLCIARNTVCRLESVEREQPLSALQFAHESRRHWFAVGAKRGFKPTNDFGVEALGSLIRHPIKTRMQFLRQAQCDAGVAVFFHAKNLHQNSVTPH
jgi:hypothetical protein